MCMCHQGRVDDAQTLRGTFTGNYFVTTEVIAVMFLLYHKSQLKLDEILKKTPSLTPHFEALVHFAQWNCTQSIYCKLLTEKLNWEKLWSHLIITLGVNAVLWVKSALYCNAGGFYFFPNWKNKAPCLLILCSRKRCLENVQNSANPPATYHLHGWCFTTFLNSEISTWLF